MTSLTAGILKKTQKWRRTLFADVASTKAAIDNDSAKVEITSVQFSTLEAEQTDVGAATPRASSFLSGTLV